MDSISNLTQNLLPKHLGFIVDGNRRWAKARGLSTLEGHRRGLKKVELMIDEFQKYHIPFLSFYLFSTENWDRSPAEVKYLMELARTKITALTRKLHKQNLKVLILGRPEPVEPSLWAKLQASALTTKDNTAGTVCFCFNYGGQQEIIDAINSLPPEKLGSLTIKDFNHYLYQPSVPPVDMIIRTSGEQRISGFLLWRAAYAEFLFLDQYFPELTAASVPLILENYTARHRRFGK